MSNNTSSTSRRAVLRSILATGAATVTIPAVAQAASAAEPDREIERAMIAYGRALLDADARLGRLATAQDIAALSI